MTIKESRLSGMQNKILRAMLDNEKLATFTGEGSRRFGFGIFSMYGGIAIRAFGTPEWFLKHRGLIEVAEHPRQAGVWYKLTDKGRTAVR